MTTPLNLRHQLYKSPSTIPDPGYHATESKRTITIDKDGGVCPVVTTGTGDTRTLRRPTKAGIVGTVVLYTDAGDLTLTVTGGYNADGDTSITFDDAGDFVRFMSIDVGGTYYWRAIAQEGTNVALEEAEFDAIIAGAITGGDNSLGITGQAQATTVNGGLVAIAGAASIAGATGNGGAVTIAGGASGSTAGIGGAVTVDGGLGTTTENGGNVTIKGGVAGATGDGGTLNCTGGSAAAGATGDGGPATFAGGAATASTNGAGGLISVTGGAGKGTGDGGAVSLVGGAGGATGSGGTVTITPGTLADEHGAGFLSPDTTPKTTRHTVNGTIITEIYIDLDGLASSGAANDVIGLAAGGDAYLGRNVIANNGVIYRVEMACIEVPAGGEIDTLLVAGSESDEAYNDTVANTATLCDSAGDWAAGKTIVNNAPAITANYYYYLTAGDTDAGEYTAGQFIIRFYGHAVV